MSIVKIHEQQKEWAIKIAAGIVTFIFCYMIMIYPVFLVNSALRQNIRDSKKRLDLYRNVQALRESMDRMENSFMTLAERAQLLREISDIAGRTQIRVNEMKTPPTEPVGGYIKMKVEMSGRGTYFSLLKFLQGVESIQTAIKVRDVTVLWNPLPNMESSKSILQIGIVFETFLKDRIKKNNG